MLDRTDFESWQQRIRLYCLGKDNGENIMKSINEGPFHMGTVSDVIAAGTEGAVQQGLVRARVLNDLSAKEKERFQMAELLVQDGPWKYDATLIMGRPFQETMQRANVVDRECVGVNGTVLDEEQSLFLAGEHVNNFDDDMDDSPENDLAINVDHVFEDDECDAFDSDVDEGPTYTDHVHVKI
ncbi:hypothetical protein Tco_0262130 [Tanacetum coccineum]